MIAGVWFAAAPWALGYGESGSPVLYNALAVGLALALFSADALVRPKAWEEGVDLLIALWAIASPWVLGYSADRNLMLNAVLVGLIVAVLAAWTATERSHFIGRKH